MCLPLLVMIVAWSCGASAEEAGTTLSASEPPTLENTDGGGAPDSFTARQVLANAPDMIWGIASETTEDGNSLYYGSFFLYPDGSVEVSFESSGVHMALLHTEWRDEAIVLYYSLKYDADNNTSEGGDVWTPGSTEFFKVEFSTEVISSALPANGGSLDITVQPIPISGEDVPSS